MVLEMIKFGNILNGRPAGREGALRVKQIVNGSGNGENIIIDFADVELLTPSYADEFIKGIKEFYPNKKIEARGYENNPVIKETLLTLKLVSTTV